MNLSISQVAALVDAEVVGDKSAHISSLAPLQDISLGSLVFANSSENFAIAENSQASAILVSNNHKAVSTKNLLKVTEPFLAFITLLRHQEQTIADFAVSELAPSAQIAKTAVIGKGCKIGANTIIKANVVIGNNVEIGANCIIHPQTTIYDSCKIGNKVIIHASCVLGADGFGYHYHQGRHLKIPHIGRVVIADEVEIGAHSTIDRATLGKTSIGFGTKIDNHVQIAHSVTLGKHNILCAFTGIAGSTKSGDNVIFAANVGVSDHVTIEDNVILGARSGVPPKKLLRGGATYLGSPARPKKKALEQELGVIRIPFLKKQIALLKQKVAKLEKFVSERS